MSTYAPTTKATESDDKLLTKFREWFKRCVEADADQRERETEDLRFIIGGKYQWSAAALKEREGANGLPGRPIVSVNLIQQPGQLIQNQAEAADLGINVHPVNEAAGEDIAEIEQGIIRRIERDSNAEQVRLHAFDRAKTCGRGYYRIVSQYDEDSDNPFDQELAPKRILYQECVYFDPSAQEADLSDAKYAFIVQWMTRDDFKAAYPKAKKSVAEGASFADLKSSIPDWVDVAGAGAVLTAECWYKETKTETLPNPDPEGKPREKVSTIVRWYKITGAEILDREETQIPLIPIVFVPGRELQPVDGKRRWEGIVRPARDGQQIANFGAASMVERVSLEPKAPFVAAAGQLTGHPEWKTANTRNWSVLEYNQVDVEGKPAPPPQRAQIDPSGTSLAMMLFQEGKSMVQMATAVYDPSLGAGGKKPDESGRKVIALQQQADAGTSNYLQNLANIAMRYEARIYLAWIPFIYDRPGRVTQILGGEDEKPRAVMLGKPFTTDDKGRPVPAAPGDPAAKLYDLSKGKYTVSVSIGKSYQTRAQEGRDSLADLIPRLPPEAQLVLIPTWLKFLDSPGSKEAAELLTKLRDAKFPFLTGDDENGPTPDQLKAQIAGLQQQSQQDRQQLMLAIQEIKTDQAKQAASLEKARIDAEAGLEKARIQAQTSIAVAQINAEAKGVAMATEAQNEAAATGLQHAHETAEAERARVHDAQQAQMAAQQAQDAQQADQGHQAGMAAAGAAQESAQATQAQQAQAQEAERAREAAAEQAAAQPQGGE